MIFRSTTMNTKSLDFWAQGNPDIYNQGCGPLNVENSNSNIHKVILNMY